MRRRRALVSLRDAIASGTSLHSRLQDVQDVQEPQDPQDPSTGTRKRKDAEIAGTRTRALHLARAAYSVTAWSMASIVRSRSASLWASERWKRWAGEL